MTTKRIVYFTEWVEPHKAKAKRRGVKLSNKNLARLRPVWMSWALSEYGNSLNVLFKLTYGEQLQTLTPHTSLLSKISKESSGPWYQPVILSFPSDE